MQIAITKKLSPETLEQMKLFLRQSNWQNVSELYQFSLELYVFCNLIVF